LVYEWAGGSAPSVKCKVGTTSATFKPKLVGGRCRPAAPAWFSFLYICDFCDYTRKVYRNYLASYCRTRRW